MTSPAVRRVGTSEPRVEKVPSLGGFLGADAGCMKKTSICQLTDCDEPTVDGLCAFHHLALVTGPDLFMGLLSEVGGFDGEALLGVIFDVLEGEPSVELLCHHDGRLGACYLASIPELPGLGRTSWELRAATYSLGIPLN